MIQISPHFSVVRDGFRQYHYPVPDLANHLALTPDVYIYSGFLIPIAKVVSAFVLVGRYSEALGLE